MVWHEAARVLMRPKHLRTMIYQRPGMHTCVCSAHVNVYSEHSTCFTADDTLVWLRALIFEEPCSPTTCSA